MKIIAKIALLATFVVALVGCHGQVDDSAEVRLTPSALIIEADGKQSVSFEVTYGSAVVTEQSVVGVLDRPNYQWKGKDFVTDEAGEYVFRATYRGMESNKVTITAIEPSTPMPSRFERHICVMDLTGTWCQFCPDGMAKLNFYVQKKEWKDRVHMLAIHDNTQGDDPMGLPLSSKLMNDFGNYGYPMFITDLRDSGSLTENVADIVPSFERSLEEFPAHSDVKISSTINGRTLNIEVKLFAETRDKYRSTLFLVENDIVAPQKDGSITHQDYKHQHVVRVMQSMSPYKDDYFGTSFGTLEAGKEATWTIEYLVPEEWNTDNMSIVALSIDSTMTVNNVAECAVGESVGYKYKGEQ